MSEAQGDSNPTKPPEIIPGQTKKGISKKQAFGRIIAAAGIVSTMGLSGDTFQRGPGDTRRDQYSTTQYLETFRLMEELSVQELTKKAEETYGIQIVSPQERSEIDLNKGKVKTIEWTKNQLLSLIASLDILPSHFYRPGSGKVQISVRDMAFGGGSKEGIKKREEDHAIANIQEYFGRDFYISREDLNKTLEQGYFEKRMEGAFPVSFFMVDSIHLNENFKPILGQCSCGTGNPPRIVFSKELFEGSQINSIEPYYYPIIVHELTHRVSRPEDYQFIRDLLGVPDDNALTKFLEEKLTEVQQDSSFKAALRNNDRKAIDAFDLITNRFDYGAKNSDEFVSVASEFYLEGKAIFLKDYSLLIGKEKAQKLYDYMKDKIFRGKEYEGE